MGEDRLGAERTESGTESDPENKGSGIPIVISAGASGGGNRPGSGKGCRAERPLELPLPAAPGKIGVAYGEPGKEAHLLREPQPFLSADAAKHLELDSGR